MLHSGARLLSRAASLTTLGRIYARASGGSPDIPFSRRALAALDVTSLISEVDLTRIPRSGSLVVVANHPFGALDGLLLLHTLQQVRGDVKLFGNQWLSTLP